MFNIIWTLITIRCDCLQMRHRFIASLVCGDPEFGRVELSKEQG